ncbi:ribonuclease P protein component [Pelagibacterium xiamenense]|uniref:ribonuclease P protein component n=1 Tax=Pelagibacterium xiamenense TaxID=2901140 RepID=UPI001E41C963|nr:ribonuclease P protein component [Pelagibacterium xiamenense]MCD7058905.1 ribonuclease P protein component [Pelagibacterium xiamenense]
MPEAPASALRRLKKRAQFLRAARGKKIAGRGFVLQAVPVAEPGAGVGYTVTKKVGNAPERNRIKRRLRAAVHACHDRFKGGYDYVLIGRRESLNEPFAALVERLCTSIERLNAPAQRTRKHHE